MSDDYTIEADGTELERIRQMVAEVRAGNSDTNPGPHPDDHTTEATPETFALLRQIASGGWTPPGSGPAHQTAPPEGDGAWDPPFIAAAPSVTSTQPTPTIRSAAVSMVAARPLPSSPVNSPSLSPPTPGLETVPPPERSATEYQPWAPAPRSMRPSAEVSQSQADARRWKLATIALGAVLIAVLAIWVFTGRGETNQPATSVPATDVRPPATSGSPVTTAVTVNPTAPEDVGSGGTGG